MTENVEADTTDQKDQEDPTAGSEELSVPKHRLDELSARLRRTEEELNAKDQLIQSFAAPKQQEEDEDTAESLGIEPEVFAAMEKKTAKAVAKAEKKFNALLGHMANSLEETRFIQERPDAAADLEEVKEYRNKQYQITGQLIPMDQAYKLFVFDKRAMGVKVKKALPKEPVVEEKTVETPDAKATTGPISGGTSGDKEFDELSVAEMEANLVTQNGVV